MATEPNELRRETIELVADVELANNLLHELNRYLDQLRTCALELLRVEVLLDDPLIKRDYQLLNGVVEELKTRLTTSVAHVSFQSDDGEVTCYLGGVQQLGHNGQDSLRYSIVEGEHPLWKDVSKPYRETIRAFLAYFKTDKTKVIFLLACGRWQTYNVLSSLGLLQYFIDSFTGLPDSPQKAISHLDHLISTINRLTYWGWIMG
ncbi:hypothetical protein Tco_0111998 [Tanacetum coccineum]